jgi:hypothetical protein
MTDCGPIEGKRSSAQEIRTTEQLSINEVLVAEFEYIAQTAFQANEDRARVSSLSLATAGSLVVAMLSTQFESFQLPYVYWAFAALFAGLTINSTLTLLQLVRLRQAWFDSILAMNQIKDFYIQLAQGVRLEKAFRWNSKTVPARFKPWSISFMLATQVSLLGGVTLGTTLILAGLGFHSWWWKIALGLGFAFFISQIILYWRLIRNSA